MAIPDRIQSSPLGAFRVCHQAEKTVLKFKMAQSKQFVYLWAVKLPIKPQVSGPVLISHQGPPELHRSM
jgi:hypothetical protein